MSVRSLGMIVLLLSSGGTMALTDAIALANPHPYIALQLAQRRSPRATWLRELNLSPEQLQKIQEIRNQYQERLNEQRQALQQAQQELKQLMASNTPVEQIREKFDQVQTLKQKLGDTRMESMLAIRDVLNPEQRQKLNTILKQRGLGRDRF